MRIIFASLLLAAAATACTKPSELQATVAPPGPPPPSGDEEVVVKVPPKHLEIHNDVIRLKAGITIQFATDSAGVLPESAPVLDEVAMVMSENLHIRIRIEGHTDNTASQDHNQALSDRRAGTVRHYLEMKGITEDRLESLGCGENTPVATNATDAGKTENRRVEFVIIRHRNPRGNCELYKRG